MYREYLGFIFDHLSKVMVSEGNGDELDVEEGFRKWSEIGLAAKEKGACMYFVGNGASAMMASHMAVDASKNGSIRAAAFNDVALLTAVSNDIAYEEVFAEPLSRMAHPGDILVSISSSGNSPNVVRAIEKAREIGLTTITLSGMDENNKSRWMGDLNFYVPAATYGVVESAHQIILHYWMDSYITAHCPTPSASICLPNSQGA